jgi:NtrC-family two-component system response regulator AlgB
MEEEEMPETAHKGPRHCLVVDDEADICQAIAFALEPDGWTVQRCLDLDSALKAVEEQPFDLALVDLRLGEQSGLDLLPALQRAQGAVPVVIITAYASIPSAVEAVRKGAVDYLPKPFDPKELRRAVAQALLSARYRSREADLDRRVTFSSHSPAMQRVLDQAARVAESDLSLLLLGETGTGKGVLAKAVHKRSKRREGPFVVVACPSMQESLLESELFGHEKGAFTGAYREHSGRLAKAHGGTLFLDEVGDLSLPVQAKLLRVLQTREYERLGGSETFQADVRIISATHVDLAKAMKEGRFREDLYYRLSGLELSLPPLRERLEDLEPLAESLLQDLRTEAGQGPVHLSREVLEAFKRYPWPGNLREMHNLLERACVMGDGKDVRMEDLPGGLGAAAQAATAEAPVPAPGAWPSIEQVEEAHIRKVLAVAHSLDEAARILGIDGVTLWRRRKKYKL